MPPAAGKPSCPSSGGRKLRWWLSLIERLRPTELQITLVLAGLAGFLGALASLTFRHATEVVHWVFTGSWGAGLSESFTRLPWWQRIVVPTVGGAAAGLGPDVHRAIRQKTAHHGLHGSRGHRGWNSFDSPKPPQVPFGALFNFLRGFDWERGSPRATVRDARFFARADHAGFQSADTAVGCVRCCGGDRLGL